MTEQKSGAAGGIENNRDKQRPRFPLPIEKYISACPLTLITEAQTSGDTVYKAGEKYILKISSDPGRLSRERRVNDFLQGKVPASETVAYCEENGLCYYLKTCVQGEPILHEHLSDPVKAAEYLADAMKMYHSIDISGCDLINPDSEGDCFVHGDFCLPNILVKDGKVSGFIDTEASGIGDPWMDYAWCIWSYEYNLGTDRYTPVLLEKLGITFDREKFDRYLQI